MAELPLAGLSILVTRPRDQALQLARDIELAGGMPLLHPLLEITPVPDRQALQKQVAQLDRVDLAIFISPNAVRFGMAAIREALTSCHRAGEDGVPVLPPALKIATVGPGSAKALRELGVQDVIVPGSQFDSEGLLALPALQAVAGWHVMIFRGDGGRELLGDTLTARGALVEYVTCYLRRKPELDVSELIKADAITVSSSEALGNLWQIGQTQLSAIPLFVPHPRIAELARVQGWGEVHLTGAGDEGVLAALLEWAANRNQNA